MCSGLSDQVKVLLVFWDVGLATAKPVEKRRCCGADDVNVFVSYLLMAKKPDKYSKRANIGADIDRLFPNKKGMVLEKGNFSWTKEELDVARSKGLKINY